MVLNLGSTQDHGPGSALIANLAQALATVVDNGPPKDKNYVQNVISSLDQQSQQQLQQQLQLLMTALSQDPSLANDNFIGAAGANGMNYVQALQSINMPVYNSQDPYVSVEFAQQVAASMSGMLPPVKPPPPTPPTPSGSSGFSWKNEFLQGFVKAGAALAGKDGAAMIASDILNKPGKIIEQCGTALKNLTNNFTTADSSTIKNFFTNPVTAASQKTGVGDQIKAFFNALAQDMSTAIKETFTYLWSIMLHDLQFAILYIPLALLMIFCFTAIALQVVLLHWEWFMVVNLGAVLVPFAMIPQLWFLAERYLNAMITVGVKFMTLAFIMATVFPNIQNIDFAKNATVYGMWPALAYLCIVAFLCWQGPGMAAAIMGSGASTLTAANAVSAASTAAAGAQSMAGSAAGKAGPAAKGAAGAAGAVAGAASKVAGAIKGAIGK